MSIHYIFKYTQDQVSHHFCTMLLIVFFLMCGTVHVVISQIYTCELNGRGHFLVLLYPYFLKKVRVYCCYPDILQMRSKDSEFHLGSGDFPKLSIYIYT